jgi:hypothetical protein
MLKSGEIISLKSGMYVLSEKYDKPLVMEAVANLLYGPSYVSLDYALAHYGLIPEYAYNVTSVTCSRKKVYDTKIGIFVYHHLKAEYYRNGYDIQKAGSSSYLIASPEKALCDKLYLSARQKDTEALERLLYEEIRFDPAYLNDLSSDLICRFADIAANSNLTLLKKMVVRDVR